MCDLADPSLELVLENGSDLDERLEETCDVGRGQPLFYHGASGGRRERASEGDVRERLEEDVRERLEET